MSRPTSFFSALRSVLPRRPLADRGLLSGSRFAESSHAGRARQSSSSSTVTSTSLRSTLFRPITIVLVFAPLLTGYLGVWQVQRLKWKVALIEEVDRNLEKEPMILPGTVNLSALPDFAFRRVLLRGKFTGPPILLGPQVRDGVPGYHLVLPLDRSSSGGTTILLNRGFVTTAHANAIRTGQVPVPGLELNHSNEDVVIEGMLTKIDGAAKGWFTPENRPESNEWFWKDVDGMAEWVGGEARGVQPVLVDAIDHEEFPMSLLVQQGIPVGRAPHIELRNQHLTYAVTWFSLCAATTVMLGILLSKGRTKPLPRRRAFGES